MKAFQDYYPDNVAQCYGCGSNNHHGHQIKTHWDGEESVTFFTPEPYHTSVPRLCLRRIDCIADRLPQHGHGSSGHVPGRGT